MQKKINLTKTVRKLPISEGGERAGHYIHDDRQLDIKYDHPAVCFAAMASVPDPCTILCPIYIGFWTQARHKVVGIIQHNDKPIAAFPGLGSPGGELKLVILCHW